MKEYKLSAKSKYSVLYLLCGLFMFFFMFAILNLSSYAKTTSFNLKTVSPRPTSSGGSCTVSFGTPSFTVNIPQDSSVASSYSKTFYYSTNLYVTTTSGTFLLRTDNYNFTATVYPNQGNTFTSDLHMSNIGSFDLDGQFISADLVLDSDDIIDYYTFNGTEYGTLTSGTYQTYRGDLYGGMRSEIKGFGISAVNSNFVTVSSSSGSGTSGFNFSDYASNSYANLAGTIQLKSDFGGNKFSSGNICAFNFDGSHQDLQFTSNYVPFVRPANASTVSFVISYNGLGSGASAISSMDFWVLDGGGSGSIKYGVSDFYFGRSGPMYSYTLTVNFPATTSGHSELVYFNFFNVSLPYAISDYSFSVQFYKATIADYMQYVKDNWNDIAPSVTDTNQNIAQSVSDIGTAQTFETSAFTDFDSSMSTSGLDTFSLSFASTPLLWCASIINTFYNNMPSGFQYLLMFVAFVGILFIVLNIGGRVVRRFGGD